ncbi:MAG: N-acetyltransferase family protein [Pseudomonadota bacterium]
MRVRDAVSADASAICAIQNQIIRDTTITFNSAEKTLQAVEKAIETADVYLALELGGRVMGFATYGPFRTGTGYSTVKEHSICLHPDACGAGHGALLLSALETRARAHGVAHMVAGISGENPKAIAFHTSQGYAQTGRMPCIGQKFGRALDLVLMQKSL